VVSKRISKYLVVKKVQINPPNSADDTRPFRIHGLSMLPERNRIVKPLLYSNADPDPEHGTAIVKHCSFGKYRTMQGTRFRRQEHETSTR
jgi:hypothetical protein